ncbi:hypothetical protein BC830DRAFT_1255160 [Chytriomyces sp. MP71]|nr:hypothetical protein BC830DRAFT_1255160 [Chytriomyces sp. MP71]
MFNIFFIMTLEGKLTERAIVHIDLDSFYAQVETVRLGLPQSVPLAVQQWQLLAAVNYAARAYGIKKMAQVEDAKKLCPHLMCVHVASMTNEDQEPKYHPNPHYSTHKISLDVYRNASKRIMDLLARFAPKFQRASIDEAYLDLTEIVNAQIADMVDKGTIEVDPESSLPVVDWEGAGILLGSSPTPTPKYPPISVSTEHSTNSDSADGNRIEHIEATANGAQTDAATQPDSSGEYQSEEEFTTPSGNIPTFETEPMHQAPKTLGWCDLQLLLAARITQNMRETVLAELHYTCSAGIAHNKTLAKLGSAMHKPFRQTILTSDQVLPFMRTLPFQKIKNLGGKLGAEVEDMWGGKTCGDLWAVPLHAMQSKLGEQNGRWVYDIVRGVCDEPVSKTQLQKSILAVKSLRPAARRSEDVVRWIGVLAAEIYLRLREEFDDNARWPKTFTVHHRIPEIRAASSKSASMPARLRVASPDTLTKLALSLLGGDPAVPCSGISLGCSGFVVEDTNAGSVARFLKPMEALEDSSEAGPESVQEGYMRGDSQPDKSHWIQCDICGRLVEPDDASLAEHADFHVAMDLHKAQTPAAAVENVGVKRNADGKVHDRPTKKAKGKAKVQDKSSGDITRFFKPK